MERIEKIPSDCRNRAGSAIALACFAITLLPCSLRAETCTTQSALPPAERQTIADAARNLALKVQSNDAAGLRSLATPELTRDFGALQYLVGVTSPRLAGTTPVVEQLYVLDATNLKPGADGSLPEAQFDCSLNHTTMEAEFDIPSLPPGRYAFVILNLSPTAGTAKPWRLSFLLRQENQWLLAGLYPRALTAAGHDGLWYWTQARQFARQKQPWNAWLFYQEAIKLLQPADFVLSTHLDKLRSELTDNTPSALSEGITVDAPLVVKGADGAEYRFTGLELGDSPDQSALDLAVHLHADPLTDQAAARKRNDAAAAALLAAYPELRKSFHGVWVYAESTGQPPFASEQPMADIK